MLPGSEERLIVVLLHRGAGLGVDEVRVQYGLPMVFGYYALQVVGGPLFADLPVYKRLENPAIHRHERHHCHSSEKPAYLSSFLHDNEHDTGMTLPKHTSKAPS